MQRIVRKRTRGGLVEERCIRGPFITETFTRDGGRQRRLVIELHGTELRLRYYNHRRILVVKSYDALLREERGKTWNIGPRGRSRKST